jgi:prepilin-type N-terminal cleavage/methylation domain-containing protein
VTDRGFTLVECVVAAGLLLVILSALAAQLAPADGAFATQSETSDEQQRLRAAVDAIAREIERAGARAWASVDSGGLLRLAPPVLPYRVGLRGADAPGTFRPDAISILTAADVPAAEMTIAQPMPAHTDVTRISPGPGCPQADPLCALAVDADVIVADGAGAFDLFSVTDVTAPTIVLRHDGVDGPSVYATGSVLSPVAVRTFYRRPATASRPPQLVRYDGAAGPDVPVVDHVVDFIVTYFADPNPPRLLRPLSDQVGPWTSYGPKPRPSDTSVVPFLAGSSCLFIENGTPIATPRLAPLGVGGGTALVPIGADQLTDGPWCPDEIAPSRYDADLFRIRSLAVTIRVESALDALRGPAGPLFARGGTARSADRYVPDLEIRTRITPVNLAPGR